MSSKTMDSSIEMDERLSRQHLHAVLDRIMDEGDGQLKDAVALLLQSAATLLPTDMPRPRSEAPRSQAPPEDPGTRQKEWVKTLQQTNSKPESLITYEEAAKFLQISQTTLRRFIREGRIPVACLGRVRRIEPSDLRSFIEAQKAERES